MVVRNWLAVIIFQISTEKNPSSDYDIAQECDSFPWQNIRLPDTLQPTDYKLVINLNLTTFAIVGRVRIRVKVKKPTTFLVLHARGLNATLIKISVGRRLIRTTMVSSEKLL
ncbi:hypothetical protein AB6A40_005376 [Gnathostoma spinigerum]|uniref:Uncharacterized protein n=1 Tax=Gnathostoma spinigerum TaxID=75299 RepID=A0ABD6EQ37_9BILA